MAERTNSADRSAGRDTCEHSSPATAAGYLPLKRQAMGILADELRDSMSLAGWPCRCKWFVPGFYRTSTADPEMIFPASIARPVGEDQRNSTAETIADGNRKAAAARDPQHREIRRMFRDQDEIDRSIRRSIFSRSKCSSRAAAPCAGARVASLSVRGMMSRK